MSTGPLVYITVAGQGILVFNTIEAAAGFLDRRGHICDDRPRVVGKLWKSLVNVSTGFSVNSSFYSTVCSELMCGGLAIPLMKSGER
jgi:hypothetical protein